MFIGFGSCKKCNCMKYSRFTSNPDNVDPQIWMKTHDMTCDCGHKVSEHNEKL
jgi:hypothetical protein